MKHSVGVVCVYVCMTTPAVGRGWHTGEGGGWGRIMQHPNDKPFDQNAGTKLVPNYPVICGSSRMKLAESFEAILKLIRTNCQFFRTTQRSFESVLRPLQTILKATRLTCKNV